LHHFDITWNENSQEEALSTLNEMLITPVETTQVGCNCAHLLCPIGHRASSGHMQQAPFLYTTKGYELPPQGFELVNGAVLQDAWLVLQEWIQTNRLRDESMPIPSEIGAQNHQVAQFGFRYDYEQDIVDTSDNTNSAPPSS
jgi:hypothetical protein